MIRVTPFKVDDMIRATIRVHKPQQLIEAYELIKKTTGVRVVRIISRLFTSDTIHMNFVYENTIVGEILLVCGKEPVQSCGNQFLNQLISRETKEEFL